MRIKMKICSRMNDVVVRKFDIFIDIGIASSGGGGTSPSSVGGGGSGLSKKKNIAVMNRNKSTIHMGVQMAVQGALSPRVPSHFRENRTGNRRIDAKMKAINRTTEVRSLWFF
jgi:hypothetical protein